MLGMKEKKLVVIKSIGTIAELGGIKGPIDNPFRLDVKTLIKMVTKYRIFEVNPKNIEDTILLTISNVRENNFINEPEDNGIVPYVDDSEVVVEKIDEEMDDETKSTLSAIYGDSSIINDLYSENK